MRDFLYFWILTQSKNWIISLILLLSLDLSAQKKDSTDVAIATQKFVKAFTDFDWTTFKDCFAKDATLFFPAEFPKRKNGQEEIEAAWKELFPEFIDTTKKFDLKLNPQNILIQLYGKTAIVTFHMGEESDYISRRTIVL